MKKCAIKLLIMIILTGFSVGSPQQADVPGTKIEVEKKFITSWFLLGPIPSPFPIFHADGKKAYTSADALKFQEMDPERLKPGTDKAITWPDGTQSSWEKRDTADKSLALTKSGENPSVAYMATYLDVKRWTPVKLVIESPCMFQVFLNGLGIGSKTKVTETGSTAEPEDENRLSIDLKLETGKYLVLVKAVSDPGAEKPWTVRGWLSCDAKFASNPPIPSLSYEAHMSLGRLLDGPKASDVSISPDGKLAAVTIRQSQPPSDDSESWIEFFETENGKHLQTFRGGTNISRIQWAPEGHRFSYTTREKSGSTLWFMDLQTGENKPILEDIQELGFHSWSPRGDTIVYSVTEKGKEDREGTKRFRNLADRQPGWRDRSYLFEVRLPDGVSRRLTAGELSTNFNGFSPDGKKLLFNRTLIDYSERPFSKTELYELEMESLEAEKIWEGRWFRSAQYGPEGRNLLILGGPSTFGSTGVNVPKDLTPNEYDTQAFLFDTETKTAECLTLDFDPSVERAVWSGTDNSIYFETTDRSYSRLYAYEPVRKTFELIDCGVEVIERIDFAKNSPMAVYTGSSAADPPKVYLIHLEKKKLLLLDDPGEEDYAGVRFGKVERWTFKNKKGVDIEGRIYYPPGFDPDERYPCIVYYYGGTSPVIRDFGGRYPKNLWAAQGYVVYVLQPGGATGFGQAFSALHVNDWGTIVADEIILGTKKFLESHPFVDPERVGCIGASFGGFMTMLLQTRTDIFAAEVAHAGISSISSYRGEGFWGYAYSAAATADSFPWNREDIYVDQSPLFAADKIVTPLLLLHGSRDTNVPPGESTQLFTALKLLGREVEYIQILDQDHHIMTYNKRIVWTKTIMAWFDRWLKGQPEWWQDLYPDS